MYPYFNKLTRVTFLVAVCLQLLLPVAGFAATITSNIVTGDWNTPGSWLPNQVPTATDDVIIADGHTITLNAAGFCQTLIVGQGTSGVLSLKGFTLTVVSDVTVLLSGQITVSASATGILAIGGNLTNNGTIDLYISSSVLAKINFTGSNDVNFITGSNSIMDFPNPGVILAKTSINNIVAFNPGSNNITVKGLTTNGFLNGSGTGTFKVTGNSFVSTPLIESVAYTIAATLCVWLDNLNFTVLGQAGSPTLRGTLRISNGTFNIGEINTNLTTYSMTLYPNCKVIVEGGILNSTGRFGVNASSGNVPITYTQTNGIVTVQTTNKVQGTTYAGFDLGTSSISIITLTGGKVVIQNPNSELVQNGTPGKDFRGASTGATLNITDVFMLHFGNSNISTFQTYYIQGVVPNFSIDNTPGATGHTLQLSAATQFNFDVNINNSNTLHLSTFSATFLKNLTNNGVIRSESGGTLAFAGTSAQMVSGSGAFYNAASGITPIGVYGLTLSNSAGVTLAGGDLNVTSSLQFSNGKINIGNNNLILESNISVMGANNNGYVVTNGTGRLTRKGVGGVNAVDFPVGTTTTYDPASITNAGTTDDFSVNVSSTLDAFSPMPNKYLQRQWNISEATVGGSDVTLSLTCAAGVPTNNFDAAASIQIGHYKSNNVWERIPATMSNSVATANNITSFSPFVIINQNAVLPVELVDFKGVANGKQNNISWSTASERDTKCFILERRNNYGDFKSLDLVAATGQSNQPQFYQWVDHAPDPLSMYRLKIMDLNGSYEYSKVISIENAGGNAMTILSNFTSDDLTIRLSDAPMGEGKISIFDMQGKLQYVQNIDIQNFTTDVKLSINNLANGSYVFVCNVAGQILSKKWVKI